jgi:hypothetical protein
VEWVQESCKACDGNYFEQDAGVLHLMVSIGAIGGVPSPARDFTDRPEVSKIIIMIYLR